MIKDRIDAGQLLGKKLTEIHIDEPVVLAIPRGGVVVGDEIARKLGCKLDVVVSKKVTPVDNPEYGIGAITHDGMLYRGEYWDHYSSEGGFENELAEKKKEVIRRLEEYRGSTEFFLEGKTVVLVDDGIATGSTVFAILNWLQNQKVKKILLAVPVIPEGVYHAIKNKTFSVIALEIPRSFSAVGQFYHVFEQVSDDEVKKILENYNT